MNGVAAAVASRSRVSPRQCLKHGGANPMFDSALVFLLIIAALGVGGVLGLLSMVVMAIELMSED